MENDLQNKTKKKNPLPQQTSFSNRYFNESLEQYTGKCM